MQLPLANRLAILNDRQTTSHALQQAATTITNHEQLCAWIRGPLRDFIPHENTIIGFGQIGFKRVHLDRTYSFDVPLHYRDIAGHNAAEILWVVIQNWFTKRELQYFDWGGIERHATSRRRQQYKRHQLRNGAFNAEVQPASGRVAFIKLFNLEEVSVISLLPRIRMATALLPGIFNRIELFADAPASSRSETMPNAFSTAELKVLRQLQKGKTNSQIAESLCRSEFTVKNHIARMLEKTGTKSRHQLAALAERVISRK